jgi:hypothetical protein
MKKIFILCMGMLWMGTGAFGQFETNNDAAALGGGRYRLTSAANSQAGSVWYKLQHNLNDPLNVQGKMYFGTDDAGADGIAFVLQNNCLAAGTSGGGIGYSGMPGLSIAVEFDTYENIDGSGDQNNHDPAYDHLAVVRSGNVDHGHATDHLYGPLPIHPSKMDVEDGVWYDFRIHYDPTGHVLSVYFDNTLRFSYPIDLITSVFDGNPYVYWGFTASTGGFFNEQSVEIDANLSSYTLSDTTICTGTVSVSLPPLTKFLGNNMALNRSAVSSSNEGPGTAAINVTDGNMGTRWSSTFSDPEWLYVDLGSVHDIDSVVLYWEGAYAARYVLQTSDDALSWVDQYTEHSGNGGMDKIIFTATNVRYVRMYGLQRATPYGYSLWEFQVYGSPKYVWSPDDGTISDIYSANPVFSPTETTAYTVLIPDPCQGAVSYTMTITVDCLQPVSLLSWTAEAAGEAVSIRWSTIWEEQSDYFEILKSEDGIHFYLIGTVKAQGNSQRLVQYHYMDTSPRGQTVYYQLKPVDIDGAFTLTDTKTLHRPAHRLISKNTLFEEETTLSIVGEADWVRLRVVDILGRVLLEISEEKASGDISFGHTLAPAMYIVQVQTDFGTQTYKIQKTQ